MIDTVLHYRNPVLHTPARCGLRLLQSDAGALVILTELPDNPGMSVTNASEEIASLVATRYDLDPASTTWIEHYPPRPGIDRAETYDEITYTWTGRTASAPHWRRIAGETVERLIDN